MRSEPLNHFLKQIASDLRYARGGIEIGEMSLRKAKVSVETIQQNLECVLQRLEMMLPRWIFFRSHLRFRFKTKRAHIGEQMAKYLQLIGRRETLELQHH